MSIYRGGSRGRVQGVHTPSPPLRWPAVFYYNWYPAKKKKTMWFIGVEVEQETSAPPPKKNPGSAPDLYNVLMPLQARTDMEQQTIEGASTSDAVGFITVVQSLKRKIKNWEKSVEVCNSTLYYINTNEIPGELLRETWYLHMWK